MEFLFKTKMRKRKNSTLARFRWLLVQSWEKANEAAFFESRMTITHILALSRRKSEEFYFSLYIVLYKGHLSDSFIKEKEFPCMLYQKIKEAMYVS